MKMSVNIRQLARKLGVDRICLYVWKRKADRQPYSRSVRTESGSAGPPDRGTGSQDNPAGRDHRGQWLELDFFESACKGSRRGDGGQATMARKHLCRDLQPDASGLSIQRICEM